MTISKKQIQHLFWRAGFGVAPDQLNRLSRQSKTEIIADLFEKSKRFEPLVLDLSKLEVDRKKLSKKERQELRKLSNKTMFELNILWLQRMVKTEAVLREKITFFFHDHFAVRLKNPKANLELNNILREHALGNFGTLLMEVSKSPAMIAFLNNKQNKKSHPNENFAREVMELFTLGRDNGYTEKDIQEAARAFTGWSFNKEGKFVFRKQHHDFEEKTILGQTGNFQGEDVIRILLEQRQTARYVTQKLVNFLICRPVAETTIEHLTTKLYASNYDLTSLIKAILESEEFWNDQSIGSRIKTPTELLVGMTRVFKIDFKEPKTIIQIQRKLNQVLFFPPNVAGWTDGRGWIDSSTLLLRMKLSSLLLNFGVIEWDEKGDMPENQLIRIEKQREKTQERIEKRVKAYPDWKFFKQVIKDQEDRLIEFFIQPPLSRGAEITLNNSDSDSIQDQVIEILSLPEYQLC